MVAKLQDPANRPLLIVVSVTLLLVLCCREPQGEISASDITPDIPVNVG